MNYSFGSKAVLGKDTNTNTLKMSVLFVVCYFIDVEMPNKMATSGQSS